MAEHTKCECTREIRFLQEETCIMDLGPGPFTIEIRGANVDIKLFKVFSLNIERDLLNDA